MRTLLSLFLGTVLASQPEYLNMALRGSDSSNSLTTDESTESASAGALYVTLNPDVQALLEESRQYLMQNPSCYFGQESYMRLHWVHQLLNGLEDVRQRQNDLEARKAESDSVDIEDLNSLKASCLEFLTEELQKEEMGLVYQVERACADYKAILGCWYHAKHFHASS